MDNRSIVQLTNYAEPVLCVAALAAISYRKQLRRFPLLSILLAVRILSFMVMFPILHFAGHGIALSIAYKSYFFAYWATYAIESLLMLALVFPLYKLAMDPLRGLAWLGQWIFSVIAGIGLILALVSPLGPHVTMSRFITHSVTGMQETQSVLMLCLMVVVALLVRPMRLQLRRTEIGVVLGLTILAMVNLAAPLLISNWTGGYSPLNLIYPITTMAAVAVWTAYFLLPEPQRRALVLPDDSRLMRWNRLWLPHIDGQPA
jgi:hypothetical protein